MSPSRSPSSDPILVPLHPHHPVGIPSSNRTPPPALASGVVRVGVTKEIVPLLREFGADPDAVIRQAGLDPRLFDDENNVIPYAALGHLVTRCVARTRCPHFGLLVGQRGTLSTIGPTGGLLQFSPSVGEALSALVEHMHLHNRGAALTLTVSGEVAMLGFAIYQPEVEGSEQILDGAMAVGMNIMRALCGSDWVPDEVLLPRRAPADPAPYRRFFRTRRSPPSSSRCAGSDTASPARTRSSGRCSRPVSGTSRRPLETTGRKTCVDCCGPSS